MNKITKVLLSISLVVLMLTGTGVGIWYGLKNSGGGGQIPFSAKNLLNRFCYDIGIISAEEYTEAVGTAPSPIRE